MWSHVTKNKGRAAIGLFSCSALLPNYNMQRIGKSKEKILEHVIKNVLHYMGDTIRKYSIGLLQQLNVIGTTI